MPPDNVHDSVLPDIASRLISEIVQPTDGRPQVDWPKVLDLVITTLKVVVLVFGCLALDGPIKEKTLRRIQRPGILVKFKLYFTLRKILTKEGHPEQVDAFYQAALKVGEGLSSDDLTRALTEILADKTLYGKAMYYEVV